MKLPRVRAFLSGGLLAVTIAAPRLARAEEPPAPRVPQAQSAGTESYSGQIVLTDLAAVGMMATPVDAFKTAALATWLFGPPVIHLLHDRPGRAAGSLGLRLLLPVAGVAAGVLLEDCDHSEESFCGLGGAAVGLLVGILTASIVDAALLAGASEGSPAPSPPLMRVGGVRLDYAGLAPERNGGGLVLGGRF